MKKKPYSAYETYDNQECFEGYASQVIEMANAQKIPIEQSEKQVAKKLKTDLSEALPARVFALIGALAGAIEKMDGDL